MLVRRLPKYVYDYKANTYNNNFDGSKKMYLGNNIYPRAISGTSLFLYSIIISE